MNYTTTRTTRYPIKRLLLSCVLIAGFTAVFVPQAMAHEPAYKSSWHYDRHAVVDHRHRMPHRLRHNKAFRYWYGHSRYQYQPYLSWNRLYDLYRYHRYYHRHSQRRDVHTSEMSNYGHERRSHRRRGDG